MATRFHFRLESLLKLRKALRQEAERHLARTIAELMEAEERLLAFQNLHAQAVESRRTAQGAVIDLDQFKAIERFLVVMEQRIVVASRERDERNAKVSEARQALAKAHQDYLMIERLKERRYLQHMEEVFQEELRAMDEIAVLRFRFNTLLSHSLGP